MTNGSKTVTAVFSALAWKQARLPPVEPPAGRGPCPVVVCGRGWGRAVAASVLPDSALALLTASATAQSPGSVSTRVPAREVPPRGPLACRLCVPCRSLALPPARGPEGGGVWVDGRAALTITAVAHEPRFVSPRAENDI